MFDRYTKIVLTIIAVALSAIAVQGTIGTARAAFGEGCGDSFSPCYVRTGTLNSLDVMVQNWP